MSATKNDQGWYIEFFDNEGQLLRVEPFGETAASILNANQRYHDALLDHENLPEGADIILLSLGYRVKLSNMLFGDRESIS